MDPISIIQNIVSLGLAVKQIADDMSSNKTEGLELAGKVQRLLPLMDKLKSKSAAELNENNLGPSLDRLNHLLDDAGCFLIQISPPKVAKGVISKFVGKVASTAKEAWNSASIVQKFIELNNKFDQILIELSAKEIFKLHGAINDLANRLDTGVGLVGTKVEKVGTNVVEMSKLVHNVQTETNKELSEIKQMVFMILQSGGNMEAFLRSSNQQARDTISNILVNSEQLVNLANISETENEGELASRASTKPSASSASARRNSISALASLLLVDFDHLVWNKADRDTVLGAGSFGSVYKCTYMGQECALKHFECLDKQKPTSRELAKIKREALIMQLASMHYNVIGFKGASVDKGMMIMELAQIPLFDLLHLPDKVELLSLSAQQKLRFHGTRWRVAIMLDIARALTYIHSHKILHRDLKTPNVLLVYDVSRAATSGLPFVAKVSDFGLASAVGMSSSGRSVGTKRAVGAVGSTPYMAPELLDFEGDEVVYTAAVDMYAFGILCNEVLTEKQPWLGLQEVHISRKVADKKERPAPHVPSCPAEEILVSRVIGKSIGGEVCCFHQEPAMRPTAATLCSGEQALLFKALQLCGTEHSSSAKTGPSVVNSTDVLEKITDAMGPSTAGNTGNTEAITKAAEEARVAEVARVAEIARAAKAAKVAETARAAVAARVPQVSDWRCTGCFLLNPDSQRQCTGCHTERPAQSVARSLPPAPAPSPLQNVHVVAVAHTVPVASDEPAGDATEELTDSEDEGAAGALRAGFSKCFHPGSYQGMFLRKWSCCEQSSKSATGCECPDKNCVKMLFSSDNIAHWRRSTGWKKIHLPLEQWEGVALNWLGDVKSITLSDNYVSGRLPTLFHMLPKLVEIRLDNNMLSGPVPGEFCQARNLKRLILNGNQLTGNLPDSIADLNLLKVLHLQSNNFRGCLNPFIGYLRNLRELRLNNNNFTELPDEIGWLSSLTTLDVSFNQLSGALPTQLSTLVSLQHLNLAKNNFKGSVPASYGKLTNLVHLNVSNNGLAGALPSTFAGLYKLRDFVVFNNEFLEDELQAMNSILPQCAVHRYGPQRNY